MTTEIENSTGSAVAVWDREAMGYDQARRVDPVYAACTDLAARAIPEGTPLCLDAGCGTGLSTVALSRKCGAVVAVDYSPESLRILEGKGLPNVILVRADVTCLPFRTGAFDASLCANTLQHVRPDGVQERAVGELRRVTRESLAVSVHHYSRGKRHAGWIKEGRPGQRGIDYIFRFTRRDLQALLPGAVARGVGYYSLMRVPILGGWIQNLAAILLGRLAALRGNGHMLIAVARGRRRDRPE